MRGPEDLRPYQEEGVAFLQENASAGLFMDMGLGKTAVVLHALADLPGPTLLVGPLRVVETVWRAEAEEWEVSLPFRFELVRGTPSERLQARRRKADIYLVNPELLPEVLNDPKGPKYRNLVIDESSLFKNSSTKRFKFLRKHLKDFDRRWILTGTPTPNSLMEIWSQIFILDRGERLDTSFGRFKRRYFYPVDYQQFKFVAFDWAAEDILTKCQDVLYRISAKDVLSRDEPTHNRILTPLPPKAMKQYREMERLAFLGISEEENISAAMAVTKTMKLRQIASGFSYTDEGKAVQIHSAKLEALQELVMSLDGEPLIVVYQFNHELKALQGLYPDAPKFSQEVKPLWDKRKLPLMFLHPQSGGHGLNLQHGGCNLVVFSGSFSYEQMSQTFARIDRPGQKYPVMIHSLIAPETVDEMLEEVILGKATNQDSILHMIKEKARAYAKTKKANSSRRS